MAAHRLAGHFSVEASAELIRHYRYAEERLMRMMAGWIALTPELPAKLLLGRHVWDCAQHADLWGQRLPELRSPAQQSEPANDRFVHFMDLAESRDGFAETAERLAGVYRVLKPHLVATYADHLRATNDVYEPPTRRILQRCLDEERRHIAAGDVVLGRLVTDPARRHRMGEWERRLGAALAEAGGVTGSSGATVVTTVDVGGVDPTPDLVDVPPASLRHALPADLSAELDAFRRALVAGDQTAIAAQVVEPARPKALAESGKLCPPFRESEVVAAAKIGEYRIIKLQLTGVAGACLVQVQWRPTPAGWRIFGIDLVRSDPLA